MVDTLFFTTHRAVSWRYYVEVDGVSVAEFVDCSGLNVERETVPITEGGRNDYQVMLPGRVKYTNLTLKRGLIDLELLDWLLENVAENTVKIKSRKITIYLANESGETAYTWDVFNAYPVKWTGPQLRADSNDLSMEELELTYTYFELKKA